MNKCPLTGKPCCLSKCYQITDVKDGKATKCEKVCQECFESYVNEEKKSPEIVNKITPAEALKTIVDFIDFLVPEQDKIPIIPIMPTIPIVPIVPLKTCPKCSSTLKDIAGTARIGCSECYSFFEKELNKVILANHGTTKHVGKRPKKFGGMSPEEIEELSKKAMEQAKLATATAIKKMPLEAQIKGLNASMKRAVDAEKYEECSAIRDELAALQHRYKQIKKLKSQMKRAIKNEKFEQAESIKKEIEGLEKNE